MESARESIAGRLDQVQLGPFSERRNEERCTPSDQRKPRRADGDESIGEDVDMARGQTDEFARDRIVLRGVLKNVRSERCEIARRSGMRPRDDGMGIVAELVAQCAQ